MATDQQVMAAKALIVVDWTSRDSDRMATGRLDGRKVTITGPSGPSPSVGQVNTNNEHHNFGTAGVFTPPLPMSDAVELRSRRDEQEFIVQFETEVQDIVFDLSSLGSIMTFPEPGTTVTKVSSDERLTLQGTTVVTGQQFNGPPSDGNGTLRISKSAPFTTVKFRVKTAADSVSPDDGIHLQIGRTTQFEFVDWTSRDSDRMATGRLDGRKVTITGPSGPSPSVGQVNTNNEHHNFGTAGVFTPPLPMSDAVELRSRRDEQEFIVQFETEVQDIVFDLSSLGSIMTFPEPGTTVTKVSSDERLTLQGTTVVTGQQFNGPPSDGNGTLRISKSAPFTTVKFRVKTAADSVSPDDGIHLQIGRPL
ncbi:hypothetical protein ACFWIY_17385 [Streptomyces sioyaensis]|uniref:hypothetical protein n=1 Tax=Streptomyces sioyaensis TaxID=67364 RepID=UPI0036697014